MSFARKEVALKSGTLPYMVAGDGPALLYLHAAGGPMQTKFLEGLAAAHTVHVPIMPGFNETPGNPKLAGMTDLADVAAEFIETVIGKPTDVMGASFGGWISLWLAVRRPELVEQLVLEAPAGLRFGMDANSLTPEEMRRALYLFPDKAAGVAAPPPVAMANGKAAMGFMKGVFVDQPLADRVGEIKARTLILMATADRIIPVETGHFLVGRIPAAHLAYIYNAAHALEVDQPDATLRLVRDFLERGAAYVVNFGKDAAA